MSLFHLEIVTFLPHCHQNFHVVIFHKWFPSIHLQDASNATEKLFSLEEPIIEIKVIVHKCCHEWDGRRYCPETRKKSIQVVNREMLQHFMKIRLKIHFAASRQPPSSTKINAHTPASARGRKHFFNFPQQQKCFVNRRSSWSVSRTSCYGGETSSSILKNGPRSWLPASKIFFSPCRIKDRRPAVLLTCCEARKW